MAAAVAAGADAYIAEPADIETECAVFDLALNPMHDSIAIGLIDGTIELHSYSGEKNTKVGTMKHHSQSVRCLEFSDDGSYLFAGSSDKSLSGINANGVVAWHEAHAHKAPINAMSLFAGNVLATGDDDGNVKVWDVRTQKVAYKLNHHDDFISALTPVPDKSTLLITCGDGTLSAVDLRNGRVVGRSDQLEEELLCGAVMKDGKKFVCGTTEGTLAIYSWGTWEDMTDRYPGHPGSINCVLPLGADTLLTGAEDGNIRVVQVQPNAVLGVIGQHVDGGVERMRLSRDRTLVASTAHAEAVQFWDVSRAAAVAASGAPLAPAKDMGGLTTAKGGVGGDAEAWDDDDESLDGDSDADVADAAAAIAAVAGSKMSKRGSAGFFSDL